MYVTYWIVICGLLMFSWVRCRELLHPHFVFTVMLAILFSDFLIRGYDDKNLVAINTNDLLGYQVATLLSFITIVVVSSFIRAPYEPANLVKSRTKSLDYLKMNRTSSQTSEHHILIAGLVILALEIVKRLWATGFDPGEVVLQMLGPRGARDWDVDGGAGDNAIFQFIRSILPFSAVAFSYLVVVAKGAKKFFPMTAFAIVMFILVTDGSRTPVVMPLASLALFQMVLGKGRVAKGTVLVICGSAVAILTSLMYRFRSTGYLSEASTDSTLVYHQDDSIYRAWYAYHYSDISTYRWDPIEWYWGIVTLPVPRVLWPGKPELGSSFFRGYKLDYVTNTFYGESAALFGVLGGTVWATLTALALYKAFTLSQNFLNRSFGLAPYLIFALYIYMCLRSTANLTAFMFLPLAAFAAQIVINRLGKDPGRKRRRSRPHHLGKRNMRQRTL